MHNPAYDHEKQGTDWDKPLSKDELALAIGRSERYVRYMKQIGFEMPGGRATIRMAIRFLEKHPKPVGEAQNCQKLPETAGDK